MRRPIGDCWLRDWRQEDAPALARYADNRKIWSSLRDAFPHPYRPEHAGEFIRRVSAAAPRTVFAIATESEAVGSIGLMQGQDVHRFTAELALHRIYAEPYAGNAASARVLEKAGFTIEVAGQRSCSTRSLTPAAPPGRRRPPGGPRRP